MNPQQHDLAIDAIKTAPPVTITMLSMAGVTISDAAYALTALYTAIMIGQHAWEKWIKPVVRRKR